VAKHDHNGAFAELGELERLRSDVEGKITLRVIEAGSSEEAGARTG
jgi:hypothetical protein